MAHMNETHHDAVQGMGEGQDQGAKYQGSKKSGKENLGKVVKISGPAVDVQFDEATMPSIYQALRVVSEGFTVPSEIDVILEVQQHIGAPAEAGGSIFALYAPPQSSRGGSKRA